MKFKKKDMAYLALIVVSTAMVFFTAGAFFADFLESTRLETTVVQYVPVTAPSSHTTVAKATTENSTTTTESVTKTTVTTSSTTQTTSTTTTVTKTPDNTTATKAGKININTATKEELMTISGIGEVYATRIIEYRELIGYFTSLDELLEVKGIGEKRLAQWKPFLTV